jgi:hypothetical protein
MKLIEVRGIGALNMKAQINKANTRSELLATKKALDKMKEELMILDDDYEELESLITQRDKRLK